MAYTTVDKIKSMFRSIKIESTGTSVITSEVENWISEIEASVNAKLKAYYVTPITGTESLKILSLIITYKVAHIIKTVLEMTSENSDKNQEAQTNLDLKADKMLEEILPKWNDDSNRFDPPIMPLPDAVIVAVPPSGASIVSSQSLTPTFTKGGDNW